MTAEETQKIIKKIEDGFEDIRDNDNHGYYLFWDISQLSEEINTELQHSYLSRKITKDEANGVMVFFNAHMDEIIEIHIKEN
jgi:hypothetical protein